MQNAYGLGEPLLIKIFAAMVANISDGIIITNDEPAPHGPQIVYVNEAFCNISGFSKGDLINSTPRILQGHNTERKELEKIKNALEQKVPITLELTNYKKSGEEFIVNLEILPVKDDVQNKWFYIAIERDVTTIRMAEKILKQSEAFSRKLFEGSPDCVKILNTEGELEMMNANGCELMEIDDFNMVKNKRWSNLWPDESKDVVAGSVVRALRGERSQFQAFCPTAKGTGKWWDVIVSPVMDDNESVSKIISSSRDITSIKNEEQRKSQFLKMVGHELKTPLTAVKGYAELLNGLVKSGDSESTTFAIDRINAQSKRMQHLLNDILDTSRLESGIMPVTLVNIELQQLLSQSVNDLQIIMPDHQIQFESHGPQQVHADKNKTEQILINLVTNAAKFSAKGSEIKVVMHPAENGFVKVEVQDKGKGISAEDQGKIFNMYYQADAKSGTAAGFGLGLYLVKEFANLQGGTVGVLSEPGAGSNFYFTLKTSE